MPYDWTSSDPHGDVQELRLWPHQSLPVTGFVAFMAGTFILVSIPLLMVLGSVMLWALLPFFVVALGGMWLALARNQRDAQIIEVLTLTHDRAHLVRRNPGGEVQEWNCNRHWATPELHQHGGPVPQYVTLRGCGRTVEIGAFLSEEERIELYDDLRRRMRQD